MKPLISPLQGQTLEPSKDIRFFAKLVAWFASYVKWFFRSMANHERNVKYVCY